MLPTLYTRNLTLPLRWRAPLGDGLGHAFGQEPWRRASCGAFPFDSGRAIEVTRRCETCIALTGEDQLPERRVESLPIGHERRHG